MRLWSVHFHSESGDDYYESFCCKKRPTEKQIQKWWDKNHSENLWIYENCRNIYIREIWEVDPNTSPELK